MHLLGLIPIVALMLIPFDRLSVNVHARFVAWPSVAIVPCYTAASLPMRTRGAWRDPRRPAGQEAGGEKQRAREQLGCDDDQHGRGQQPFFGGDECVPDERDGGEGRGGEQGDAAVQGAARPGRRRGQWRPRAAGGSRRPLGRRRASRRSRRAGRRRAARPGESAPQCAAAAAARPRRVRAPAAAAPDDDSQDGERKETGQELKHRNLHRARARRLRVSHCTTDRRARRKAGTHPNPFDIHTSIMLESHNPRPRLTGVRRSRGALRTEGPMRPAGTACPPDRTPVCMLPEEVKPA